MRTAVGWSVLFLGKQLELESFTFLVSSRVCVWGGVGDKYSIHAAYLSVGRLCDNVCYVGKLSHAFRAH